MIGVDDARRTLDLGDRYVIQPEFGWWRNNHAGARRLPEGFAYTSDTNDRWLDAEGVRELLQEA